VPLLEPQGKEVEVFNMMIDEKEEEEEEEGGVTRGSGHDG